MAKEDLFHHPEDVPLTKADRIIDAVLSVTKDVADYFLELLKRVGVVAIVGGLTARSDSDWLSAIYGAAYVALAVWALHPVLRALADAVRETNRKHPFWIVARFLAGLVSIGVAMQVFVILQELITELLKAPISH